MYTGVYAVYTNELHNLPTRDRVQVYDIMNA